MDEKFNSKRKEAEHKAILEYKGPEPEGPKPNKYRGDDPEGPRHKKKTN